MSFLSLPNELLLLIATESNNLKDIYSLILTNRTFYGPLITTLYRIAAQDQDRAMRAFFYGAVHRNERLIGTLLEKSYGISIMDVRPGFAKRIPNNNTEITIQFVLSQGANLTLQPGFGQYHWHALYWAVSRGDEPLTRLLLENGVVIDSEDTSGRTALNEAILRGDNKVTQLLLDYGASTTKRDPYGRSLIDVASTYGHREIIMMILNKRPSFFRVGNNSTIALLEAVFSRDEGLVRELVVHGADLNTRGMDGRTALHIATKRGQVKIARMLVEGGANINQPDSIYQQTPLHIAIKEGQEGVLQLLIENGADCMLMDKGGRNATDIAIKHQKRFVQVLRGYAESHSSRVQKPTFNPNPFIQRQF